MENNLNQLFEDSQPAFDVAAGEVVIFKQAVFGGSFKSPRYLGERLVHAVVERESYGADKQQHTFSLSVIASEGFSALTAGSKLKIKGRNLYKECRSVTRADQSAYDDKHARGARACAARETRKAVDA